MPGPNNSCGPFFPQFLPKLIVAIYSIIILLKAASFFAGTYIPPPGVGGEIYLPYLDVSGPFVWGLAHMLSLYLTAFVEHVLKWRISPEVAIVIIPGIFNILLGGVQWYCISNWGLRLWSKWKNFRSGESGH